MFNTSINITRPLRRAGPLQGPQEVSKPYRLTATRQLFSLRHLGDGATLVTALRKTGKTRRVLGNRQRAASPSLFDRGVMP